MVLSGSFGGSSNSAHVCGLHGGVCGATLTEGFGDGADGFSANGVARGPTRAAMAALAVSLAAKILALLTAQRVLL